MAKLAIRVTSDRTKREHVITGDEVISIEFLIGNKYASHVQVTDENTHFQITHGDRQYSDSIQIIEKET